MLEDYQLRFLRDVQDFHKGYFRHTRFEDLETLSDHIRQDILDWLDDQVTTTTRAEIKAVLLKKSLDTFREKMKLLGVEEELL